MNTESPPSSIEALLQQAQALLRGVDSPALEAGILLAHLLDKDRSYLMAWPQRELTSAQRQQYLSLISRRAGGEPIAYITGKREFWSLPLSITPHVLIPRPETEHLVEATLERIPRQARWLVADLGTGSGAIALAIASERPHCRVLATDQSRQALALARENAQQLKLSNIEFHHGSWFDALPDDVFCHVIVSNPPYVADTDPHLQQGDLRFEPPGALASGPDGLDDIRLLVQGAEKHLLPGGWLLLEHGYDQGTAVATLFKDTGFHGILSLRDYGERERATAGQRP